MIRSDGSIISANFPSGSNYSRLAVERDYGIYRCLVVDVLYVDDSRNITFRNPQVTYRVSILGGKKEGQILENVKVLGLLGGQFNYHERIFRKSSIPPDGSRNSILTQQDGDIVYVTFINGDTKLPIIIGAGTSSLDEDSTGATKADGPISRSEYNGIFEKINKEGEYELTRKGGTYSASTDFFTPNEGDFEAKMEFLKGKMIWSDPNSTITLDKEAQTYTVAIGSGGLNLTLDGSGDSATIKTAGGTLINVDGAGGLITVDAAGTTITIDQGGEITLKASSKVNIKAPLVDVGEGAAFSSTLFENLLTEFAIHTHTGNLAAPTSPPLAPLLSLVGSQSVKVKD